MWQEECQNSSIDGVYSVYGEGHPSAREMMGLANSHTSFRSQVTCQNL